jgi:hypothetical protein
MPFNENISILLMIWFIRNENQKMKKSWFDESDIINVKQKYH